MRQQSTHQEGWSAQHANEVIVDDLHRFVSVAGRGVLLVLKHLKIRGRECVHMRKMHSCILPGVREKRLPIGRQWLLRVLLIVPAAQLRSSPA